MKLVISILGTLLIIFGIIGFSYKYLPYTTTEKVAEVGNVKITAESEKVIVITPTASAIMLAVGVILVIIGVSRKI